MVLLDCLLLTTGLCAYIVMHVYVYMGKLIHPSNHEHTQYIANY